jgi:hypothetical protein
MSQLATEVVRIRPKAGQEERLRALRAIMVAEYEAHWAGRFSTELYELEDGTWLDLWTWETRALAEEALASPGKTPAFEEWKTLVEPVAFDWAAPGAWGTHTNDTN